MIKKIYLTLKIDRKEKTEPFPRGRIVLYTGKKIKAMKDKKKRGVRRGFVGFVGFVERDKLWND